MHLFIVSPPPECKLHEGRDQIYNAHLYPQQGSVTMTQRMNEWIRLRITYAASWIHSLQTEYEPSPGLLIVKI